MHENDMKKNDKKQQEKKRHFGLQLRDFLDHEGRKYRWVWENTNINRMRLQRIFNGSEPTINEAKELAALFGLTLEQVDNLDKMQHIAS